MVQISRSVSLSGRERAFLLKMLSKFTGMNLRFSQLHISIEEPYVTSRSYVTLWTGKDLGLPSLGVVGCGITAMLGPVDVVDVDWEQERWHPALYVSGPRKIR